MPHLVLLGDSIFDNVTYVTPGPNVIAQVRSALPSDWRVSPLAFDGSVAKDVEAQLLNLPPDASHLVISAGGNDLLQQVDLLVCPVSTATEALLLLDDAVREFEGAYCNLIRLALVRRLPLVVCTIYDCNFQDPQFQRCARLAIALYNDGIIRVATENNLAVIDLRFVCCEPSHYANEIEPSVAGGERIAAAIARAMLNCHPRLAGAHVLAAIDRSPAACAGYFLDFIEGIASGHCPYVLWRVFASHYQDSVIDDASAELRRAGPAENFSWPAVPSCYVHAARLLVDRFRKDQTMAALRNDHTKELSVVEKQNYLMSLVNDLTRSDIRGQMESSEPEIQDDIARAARNPKRSG